MNCFQFVIWRSLTHPSPGSLKSPSCCELLSICDLTIFDTPLSCCFQPLSQLWIAFNLWFDDLWHTLRLNRSQHQTVVNCFQFVIWRSLTHQKVRRTVTVTCCELLSICDLTIFDTPYQGKAAQMWTLWIAFNLWFDDLWHTSFAIRIAR